MSLFYHKLTIERNNMPLLKFEGLFFKGDIIRAYDFPVTEGREDRYVEGVVVSEKVEIPNSFGAVGYKVKVIVDTLYTSNPRSDVYVPFEVYGLDNYIDNRVVKI